MRFYGKPAMYEGCTSICLETQNIIVTTLQYNKNNDNRKSETNE